MTTKNYYPNSFRKEEKVKKRVTTIEASRAEVNKKN